MNKQTNKKALFLALLVTSLSPLFCFAKTIQEIVDGAKNSLVPLGASLAAIAFIVAGIMYLMGTGNPSRLATAKTALIAAVIGIVIIVLAESAKTFVSGFFGLGN